MKTPAQPTSSLTILLALACGVLAVAWPDWRAELAASGYYYGACGDGVVDPGEACDDGNVLAGDCCSPTCTPEPDGCPCDDGERCTGDDGCLAGTCLGVPDAACEAGGCAPAPAAGCRESTTFADVTLLVEDRAPDTRDELAWRWRRDPGTPLAAFGDPATSDGYSLCLYEHGGGAPALVFAASAGPGGTCGGEPCWRSIRDGWVYRDRAGASDGLTRIELESGGDVIVRGAGAALVPPAPPLALPVTVQLQGTHGECWEARYFAAGAGRNDAERFRGAAGGDRPDGGPVPPGCPGGLSCPDDPASPLGLDLGWTGIAHDLPAPSVDLGPLLACSGAACVVDGPVAGTALVPVPISAGGVPVCVVPVVREPLAGAFDGATGAAILTAPLTADVYLVQPIAEPCPRCVGDPTPGDGARGGACSGGATPGAPCDAGFATGPFGVTSTDCLPSGASVAELEITLQLTTDTVGVAADTDCASPFFDPGSCYCEGQVNPNACIDGVCSPTGECAAGPIDGLCSGASFRACRIEAGTGDCEDFFPGAGTCEMKFRPCFGDAIVRTGACDLEGGALASVFCVPATRAAAINTVYGLPGPGTLALPFAADGAP